MSNGATDFLDFFRLKPTRAARVSEISEATAASSIPPEERVNFHIGNPVQEPRLSSAFLRSALGLDVREQLLSDDRPDQLLRALGWSETELPAIELLASLVRKSAPYLPRGGFARNAPSPLAVVFSEWLQQQQEPLAYDLGQTSGHREIILASGGVVEVLRVFFHVLSHYLARLPARVLLFQISLPDHITSFKDLRFESLPVDEPAALARIHASFGQDTQAPTFVVLGSPVSELMRRSLRALAPQFPLFFLEANDAPNNASLARESRLVDRVIRFLTPGIMAPRFREFSLVFVAGNAAYLAHLETIHFQLKGTPSASEVELLTFLLQRKAPPQGEGDSAVGFVTDPPLEGTLSGLASETTLARHALRVERHLESNLASMQRLIDEAVGTVESHVARLEPRFRMHTLLPAVDRFAGMNAAELVLDLAGSVDIGAWSLDLQVGLLSAFSRHHPEYDPSQCLVVSGSSRTALGLLGFHCGIREVVIPDLSWTYEHCFPSVHAVPLTPSFDLDADAVIQAVEERIAADPAWIERGAVVLNNPHNATGNVFEAGAVRRLVLRLLERGVTVIDDLAYQSMAPSEDLPEIPTVRQIANDLARSGEISAAQAQLVITVHSMSKTDCLAGARLCVVEIRQAELFRRFSGLNGTIRSNIGAMLLSYLFYRGTLEAARGYWRLRNRISLERMRALSDAVSSLPAERNPHAIEIASPRGSMYPRMVIPRLPAGLSLEWIASGLARQGIGMIPLSTFARTEKGYETARTSFRLTLGGTDGAAALRTKARRVLIDLNRLIAEEGASYSLRRASFERDLQPPRDAVALWDAVENNIRARVCALARTPSVSIREELRDERTIQSLIKVFLPERLAVYRQRFVDRSAIADAAVATARADNGKTLGQVLENEFYKDSLERRVQAFRQRCFDRTVHPTQMYSIWAEAAFDSVISSLLRGEALSQRALARVAREMIREFLGLNVAINSSDEGDEIVLDLDAHVAAELYGELQGGDSPRTFVSFWGDWDGSNRPSGQGHRLVASVLIENVNRLTRLLRLLVECDHSVDAGPDLLGEIEKLPRTTRRFVNLLNEITALTHQLELRYRGILPFHATPGRMRRLGMSLHMASDPVTSLWRHNDRLERRMLELRRKRREALEYYFSLNKRLRKELHRLIPDLLRNAAHPMLLREAAGYRDLLKRFLVMPRINQGLITAPDPFAIDTTAINIHEINEVGARYGNPGMVLALQVSMSTKPEALIALYRKMHARREHVLRDHPGIDLPSVWLVPLFEDLEAVRNIGGFLDRLWDYALQSRRLNQETRDRFAEMVEEVFIAGSDLSQQEGQSAGAHLYRQAKHELMRWLANHGLVRRIRIKLGSGEPMQRQGGYYSEVSGTAAFLRSGDTPVRLAAHLRESTRRSAAYAVTPLLGIHAGGDLRTFQSALSEKVRHLRVDDFAGLLHHVADAQRTHLRDLGRASDELAESRLRITRHGEQALERLTLGTREQAFDEFLKEFTDNFRQILYGREEDVVGIHIISYFVARTAPPLRDRPTVRPGQGIKEQGSRILERIARTIPLSRYGSLLRAIAHNQAQTAVLGINQLTTGLFRALDLFARRSSIEGDPEVYLADRILPHLPVYEMLQSLRLYHDVNLLHLNAMERAFPPGNSALLALREDIDAMSRYIPLFQQELLRRHGIDVSDFFEGTRFISELLPTVRPDLAVLLQPDLFNSSLQRLRDSISGTVDGSWLDGMTVLLAAPEEVRRWRLKAWVLLERPVFQRVQSFAELATSLYSLSSKHSPSGTPAGGREPRLSSSLAHFFRVARGDDEMRQFLAAAMEYLTAASEGMLEVPANIIRAMKEVERIAAIEDQPLSSEQQDRLRFYLLQIARIAGENG